MIRSEDDVLVVCPTILTEDGMQAQHLGATLALYRLVKGQVRAVAVLYFVYVELCVGRWCVLNNGPLCLPSADCFF